MRRVLVIVMKVLGVIVAVVIIAAIAIFIAFLPGALEKMRGQSCHSNAEQIGLAIQLYAYDYEEHLPYHYCEAPQSQYWYQVLFSYVKHLDRFNCPSNTDLSLDENGDGQPGYAWNYPHMPYSSLHPTDAAAISYWHHPSEVMMLCCAKGSDWQARCAYCPFHPFDDTDTIGDYHEREGIRGANVIFMDGHVKWLPKSSIRAKDADTAILWGHSNPE